MAGKGNTYRPVDQAKWSDNYDAIFNKKETAVDSLVLVDVADERKAQDKKWGPQDHPDLCNLVGQSQHSTVHEVYDIPDANTARQMCKSSGAVGDTNWGDILLEEFVEAMEEAEKKDQVALREELIQVAAVAVAWIECIDRRK